MIRLVILALFIICIVMVGYALYLVVEQVIPLVSRAIDWMLGTHLNCHLGNPCSRCKNKSS